MPHKSQSASAGTDNAPDKCKTVLLLIDVINDLEWEGGELVLESGLEMARKLADLRVRAKENGVPVIFVNDNFGRWRSDFRRLVEHCLQPGIRGKPLAEILRPDEDDYFVLKPRHSGFYSSSLDVLLKALGAETLILTGIAGNICVLYTANDAYMREYKLIVPRDCTVSNSPEENERALAQMENQLKASTISSENVNFTSLED